MTKLQQQINTFMLKADQELPAKPSIPSEEICTLRLRLIAEELMELADAMGFHIRLDNYMQPSLNGTPGQGSHWQLVERVPGWKPDLVEIADAFSDLNYVNVGGQSAFGIDGEPCDQEVHDSNMSKFIDGYKDEHGKWIKGPSYRRANLRPILADQGAQL